jgi:RHS repeat-associated protein
VTSIAFLQVNTERNTFSENRVTATVDNKNGWELAITTNKDITPTLRANGFESESPGWHHHEGRWTLLQQRLVKVFEDPGASNFETDYTYDALGNLLQVDQGSQHRFFTYDNLSRLKTAKNPEQVSGSNQIATAYDYDDGSNLILRTNPNGTTVGFTYDGLNRVKSKTLSSGGTWDYTYDSTTILNAKGRLVSVALHGGTDGYYYDGYDAMGRVTASHQITSSGVATGYAMSYGYDLAGNMTSETYPSGRQVLTEYDSAGRTAGISAAGGYYAGATATDATNRIQYAAQGAVSAMILGNGKWEHTLFNARLQPTEIGLGANSTASDLLKLQYTYNTTGQANNNGNLQTQTITAPKTSGGNLVLTQTYTYDALNRLQIASENGSPTWTQTYDYDRWGNRAVRVGSYIPQSLLTPESQFPGDMSAFSSSTNRIVVSGFGYDTSGNVTGDPTTGANNIAYDSENRQISYTKSGVTTTYSYDGDGRRVKRVDNSGTIIFVYNAGGELVAEYTSGTPSNGGTSYLTSDHLGSTRVVTSAADGSGNVTVKARYDYLPFGEEIGSDKGNRSSVTGYVTSDSTRQKFTQKERDNESGLDYFLARYYSSAQGRFMSPDPGPPNLGDPQIWNRYAYCGNDPLSYVDPDGLFRWGASLGGNLTDQELRERVRNAKSLGDAFKTATIIFQRNAIRNSLAEIEKAQRYYGAESPNGKRLGAVRSAYGEEGKGGPVVGVDPLIRGGGETRNGALVLFRPQSLASTASLGQFWAAGAVAHEGQHIVNFQRGVRSGFEDEITAYEVNSIMVQTRLDLAPWMVYGPNEDHLFYLQWLSDPKTLPAKRRQTMIDHLKGDPLYKDIVPKAKGRRKGE